jgi:arylsulfatase A-like enzyme
VPPNILLIAADTLRADHLGCYGYQRPTSPAIDQLAADGLLFEQYYVNHFPTIPSFTTLFSGVDGCEHRIVRQTMGPWYTLEAPLLAERLRQAGYLTTAVDNLITLRSSLSGWFARGFDHYLGFRFEPSDPGQARWVTDRALQILERVGKQPFFLFVHYWDAHNPYWPPPDAPMFDAAPTAPGEPTLVQRFTDEGDHLSALTVRAMLMEHVTSYPFIVAQYDREVWNIDREVGRLLEGLSLRGLDRDTLIVFLSDHGECFGEFGAHFDHAGPADANTRVPLVMRWPGTIAGGERRAGFFDTTDVHATLLAAAGVARTGRDLLDGAAARDFVVSGECTRQANWILRTGDFKLVDPAVDPATGTAYPDLRGRPRGGPTLHDMRAREEEDVSAQHPELQARMTRQLRSWLSERLAGQPDPIAALGPTSHSELLSRSARHFSPEDIPHMPWNTVIRR